MSPIKYVDIEKSARSVCVCPHREDLQRWRSHAGLDGGEVQNTQWGGWTAGEGEPDGQKTFILTHLHVYWLDSDFKIVIFPLPFIIYSEANWTAFIVSRKGENVKQKDTVQKEKKWRYLWLLEVQRFLRCSWNIFSLCAVTGCALDCVEFYQ